MRENKLALLSTTPVLRAVIYAVVGVVGVAALIAGAIDATVLTSWIDRVPAIAATLASVLALANIHPTPATPPMMDATPPPLDPTAAYLASLTDAHHPTQP